MSYCQQYQERDGCTPSAPHGRRPQVNARKGLRGSGPGIGRLTAFRESAGVGKDDAVSIGKDVTALRQTPGFVAERYPIRTVSVFGPGAREVKKVIVMDWSGEAQTTTEADLAGPHEHPHYAPTAPRQVLDGYLLPAGTEAARDYGGIIEGALESAEEVAGLL